MAIGSCPSIIAPQRAMVIISVNLGRPLLAVIVLVSIVLRLAVRWNVVGSVAATDVSG